MTNFISRPLTLALAFLTLMAPTVSASYLDWDFEETLSNSLRDGQTHTFHRTLYRGYSYRLEGICSLSCSDLDIKVLDSNDHTVAYDLNGDDEPAVEFDVDRSGTYTILVTMADCSASTCGYEIDMYSY